MPVDASLLKLLANKEFRDKWLTRDVSESISTQIQAMRLSRGWSHEQLAGRLGSHKSIVARYERPDYDGYTVVTLLKIATVFDVALVIRFVSWTEYLGLALVIAPPPFGVQIVEDQADG